MPLVMLSKKQFDQKRPHGPYQKYLAYIGARRPPVDRVMAQGHIATSA